MYTSIQVESDTKILLQRLKKTYNARSYDDTIRALVGKKSPSMYGALAGNKKISISEILDGLRDKDD